MDIGFAQVGEQSSICASREVGESDGGGRRGEASASAYLRTLALHCFCSPVSPMLEGKPNQPANCGLAVTATASQMLFIRKFNQ